MHTGIILGNTGSPTSPEPEAVKAYLARFLMDPRIRPLPLVPWWFILHCAILPKRKYASAQRYRRIWRAGRFPLDAYQSSLAAKLERLLNEKCTSAQSQQTSFRVRSAMSYGSPTMRDVVAELVKDGCERLILLPLYPQSGYAITGSVVDAFQSALFHLECKPETTIIDNYHDDPLYLAAIADSVRSAGFDAAHGDKLVLSFHSLPLKDEERGDSYHQQVEESSAAIADALDIPFNRTPPDNDAGASSCTLGFQCVFGKHPETWLGPLTENILRGWHTHRQNELLEQGTVTDAAKVFLACPGFAIDCLETLDDIPEEIAPLVDDPQECAAGAKTRFFLVPCLNDGEAHSAVIMHVLEPYLA